jgi:hypothetical protein
MQDINREASAEPIDEREDVNELEPMVLPRVTEVTGSGDSGHDGDNIVWGSF